MRTPVLVCVIALAACAHAPPSVGRESGHPRVGAPAFAVAETALEPLAPIALDGNDGTALDLKELSVAVSIHGPIAETTVHARFQNPFAHQTEGRFRLLLPPRSSIARLAMKMGGAWREAEAGETLATREVYDEIIHRRRDPLLVEQPRGREVAARIAPIFANEEKEVILRYTSEIATDRPMVIPLRGLPAVGTLHVSVVEGLTAPVGITTHDEKPTSDVRYRPNPIDTARSGDITATRVRASADSEPQPLDGALYLVDTSASADLDAAEALLHALPKGDIIAYDQTAVHVTDVKARGALGYANLRAGLELAKAQNPKRIVIIGGGTPGAIPAGVERIDVLGTTALVDARVLRPLATNGVVIEDASLVDPEAIVQRLTHRVKDEERIVYTKSEPSTPKDDAVEHAYAASRVDELVARGTAKGWTESTKKEVISLARAQRLATPFTSLIVLESDRDVDLLHVREGIAKAPPPAPPAKPRGGAHIAKAPAIRMGATTVSGRIPPEIIQRIVRQHTGQFRACYNDGLRRDPQLAGRVAIKFVIGRDGHVIAAADGGSEIKDAEAIGCMAQAFASILFPEPDGGIITVVYPFVFSSDLDAAQEPPPMPLGTNHPRHSSPFEEAFATPPEPWTPEYKLMRAEPAHAPRTPIGFIALGESLEASGDRARAARAYASLAELWPERTELLRAAAVRLDLLHAGDPLAVTLLRRAVAERPDQPSGHHLLGLVLLRAGDRDGARAAFRAGAERRYELRYASVLDLFRADLELLEPSTKPLTRVSLAWETDTSDLDVVLFTDKEQRSAGMTVSWAADGFGPEVMDASKEVAHVSVALRRRGMGGDVTGMVHVIKRNERGDVTVEPRSFAIMNEGSSLDLGRL